jgi:hypothetical protein
MPRALQILLAVVVVAATAALVIQQLPRVGYDSDVTRIGQGRPALVLVYENFSPPSMEAMAVFDEIRDDYAERLDFLVADVGSPRGQAFITQHGVRVGQVLTFRGDGSSVRADPLQGGAPALRERLRVDLGL